MPTIPGPTPGSTGDQMYTTSGWNASGISGGPQWVYFRTDTMNGPYLLETTVNIDGQGTTAPGSGSPPTRLYHEWLIDAEVVSDVQVIYTSYDASQQYQVGQLTVQSDNATSGGLGTSGVIYTTSAATEVRLARLGGDGLPIEKSDLCARDYTIGVGKQFGQYNEQYDNSGTAGPKLLKLLQSGQTQCPNFVPSQWQV